MDKETQMLKETSYQFDYEDQIKKDYEYIGLKISDLSCLIEVIPIIDVVDGQCLFDYDYKYLIPLEITSLNMTNKIHQQYLKNILRANKSINVDDMKINQALLEKEKEVFLYDEKLRKNKNNDMKDKEKEKGNKNKGKPKEKKGDKKRKKPLGPSEEKEITNFKFQNFDDYY